MQGEEADERPLLKLTQFSIYDQQGHLCALDAGAIEQNQLLHACGFLKPVYRYTDLLTFFFASLVACFFLSFAGFLRTFSLSAGLTCAISFLLTPLLTPLLSHLLPYFLTYSLTESLTCSLTLLLTPLLSY